VNANEESDAVLYYINKPSLHQCSRISIQSVTAPSDTGAGTIIMWYDIYEPIIAAGC
jgi:hypothetical protein